MKELKQYIERQNMWNRMSSEPEMDINNLTAEQKGYLSDCLECDFSPENLTCDGERSWAESNAQARYLNACVAQLNSLS